MLTGTVLALFPIRLTINVLAVCFALALFLLSLYSWFRRKHFTLLMFAGAFLAFLVEELLEVVVTGNSLLSDYVTPSLTLVALVLFFVGLLFGSGIDWRKGSKPGS